MYCSLDIATFNIRPHPLENDFHTLKRWVDLISTRVCSVRSLLITKPLEHEAHASERTEMARLPRQGCIKINQSARHIIHRKKHRRAAMISLGPIRLEDDRAIHDLNRDGRLALNEDFIGARR